ncbi:unnamed protein product [Rotaria sp. Silwood1]|nr:unnamed protein product [Rotaria sp. Silwood1]
MDQYVNEKHVKHKLKSYRYIFNTCPLTFDGAYGLTEANHSIKFCKHETTRRIELYFHFTRKHQLKKIYAQRLVQAIVNNEDPHIIKLFNENEDVLDHFYKVQCPFVYENIHTLNYSQQKTSQFFPNPIPRSQVLTSGIPLSSPAGIGSAWKHGLR